MYLIGVSCLRMCLCVTQHTFKSCRKTLHCNTKQHDAHHGVPISLIALTDTDGITTLTKRNKTTYYKFLQRQHYLLLACLVLKAREQNIPLQVI
jgi:hypothetical protein